MNATPREAREEFGPAGRRAERPTTTTDIEYAEAAGDWTDQPDHESQNVHRQNVQIVRITDDEA